MIASDGHVDDAEREALSEIDSMLS
jgi:tellurite resistance protein